MKDISSYLTLVAALLSLIAGIYLIATKDRFIQGDMMMGMGLFAIAHAFALAGKGIPPILDIIGKKPS